MIEELEVKENKHFLVIFSGKHLEKRPKINKKPICQNFHLKGFLFENFRNKEARIPRKKLIELQKKGYI